MRSPLRRLYYATLNEPSDPQRLWQSVRRRSSLPTLFVLDDCHQHLEGAGMILERLTPELKGGTVRLLAPLATITRWLYNEALEQTFLPALFALEGIALFRPDEPVLAPLVSVGLLAKSKQYEEVGPAIEPLCERVKSHGALRRK